MCLSSVALARAFPRRWHARSQNAHRWGTAWGAGESPRPSHVTSPRKTSHLCSPLCDKINGEEKSLGMGGWGSGWGGSADTSSCLGNRANPGYSRSTVLIHCHHTSPPPSAHPASRISHPARLPGREAEPANEPEVTLEP